jgi:SAM-dependent methyltransferase
MTSADPGTRLDPLRQRQQNEVMAADPFLPARFNSRGGREHFRLTFDEDAAAYDASRPVPPADVFDELIALAGLQRGDHVLEIGPGTGQATRPLLERGLGVRSIEIGEHLAALARQRLAGFGDQVDIVHADFERWDPAGEHFDAVFSCNAFHWIDPEVRFAKTAALLESDGHLVVLATPWVIPPGADSFWWDVQEDYRAVGDYGFDPASAHPDRVQDLAPLVLASGYYQEPVTARRLFTVEFTADAYVLNLSTQSGTKELEPAARAELLERIRRRVQLHGGTIAAHLLAVLTVARVR